MTTESSEDFPAVHGPEIERLVREEGAAGVIAFVQGRPDPAQRLQLWSLAQRRIGDHVPDADLDDFIEVVEAGIDEALSLAERETDAERRRKLTDFANVLSYNLAAGLADCWESDTRTRERRHLECGLEAAELCLRWREELGKGPGPFSMAWWAKGIHLLALDQVEDAVVAFEQSLRHAERAAREHGEPATRDSSAHWSVLLGWGYLALAQQRQTSDGSDMDAALAALEEAAADRPHDAEDLRFCAAQLRCARARHGSA